MVGLARMVPKATDTVGYEVADAAMPTLTLETLVDPVGST